MMFAQEQLAGVPDTFWKNFSIVLLVLLGAAVAIVSIWAMTRKPSPVKLNDDPAIEVRKSPKRYNHDDVTNRFMRVEVRLDGHDAEMEQLWTTMRNEDKAIREKNAERFEEIAHSLGRIEGALGSNPLQKK